MTYHDVSFEKTHNLVALLAFCVPSEPSFEQWRETVEILTPYATEFRYPGDVLEPELSEAKEALNRAESLVNFIMQLLPPEVRT